MVFSQRESIRTRRVVEGRGFFVLMTLGAVTILDIMAPRTVFMHIFAHMLFIFGRIMAPTAIFLTVAVYTTLSKNFDMFFMSERNFYVFTYIRGVIDKLFGFHNVGVQFTEHVGGVGFDFGGWGSTAFCVTHHAIVFMTPFAVTCETLTVISALEAWLLKIGAIATGLMAFTARGCLAWFAVMVADCTTTAHGFHFQMQFVRKNNRNIEIRQLVEDKEIRQIFGRSSFHIFGARARFKGGAILCGVFDLMAVRAVHFGGRMSADNWRGLCSLTIYFL